MYATKYHRASSAAEAAAKLSGSEDGKIIAGGQTLLPTMKARLAEPTDLISLDGAGLTGVGRDGNMAVIGAMATHAEVAASGDVPAAVAALAGGIGDPAVRHRGTIGGSVANNDPAADYPAACMATGAVIRTDKREITAEDYFTGLFETALEDGEVIVSIAIPDIKRGAYAKFPNPASRYALVGVFVAETDDGVRVAVTGAGENGVFRHAGLEAALNADFSEAAVDGVEVTTEGLLGNMHAPTDYMAALIKTMTKRAVASAA